MGRRGGGGGGSWLLPAELMMLQHERTSVSAVRMRHKTLVQLL